MTSPTDALHSERPAQAHGQGHYPSTATAGQHPASLVPESGWHVIHLYYQVDRRELAALPAEARLEGRKQFVNLLESEGSAPGGARTSFSASRYPATRRISG